MTPSQPIVDRGHAADPLQGGDLQSQAGETHSQALIEELMGEIEHLRLEKANAEAQADELASSLASERRRSDQVRSRCCCELKKAAMPDSD